VAHLGQSEASFLELADGSQHQFAVLLQCRLFRLRRGWFARCLGPGALLVSARPPRRLATPAIVMSGLASKALTLSRSCAVSFEGRLPRQPPGSFKVPGGTAKDLSSYVRDRVRLVAWNHHCYDRIVRQTGTGRHSDRYDGTNYRARYCSHAERRLPKLKCCALVSHC
jgi:hypothetical protein